MNSKQTLETLNFDNLTLRSLPIDSVTENVVRQVPNACFSLVTPTPVKKPQLVAYSQAALDLLDIDPSDVKKKEFVEYISGNQLFPGCQTAAHCYCGHQFGFFSGQLGDGAAMYLGEIVNSRGERWELQLKGAGHTPYSRQADGRKVLRSSIREFLCSEAMFHLGVPTTRAGTCVTSDSTVVRDIFYSGNPINERCTIVSRIAPTFIRFGSFEIFKDLDRQTARKGPSNGRVDILGQLLDHVIRTYYSEIWAKHEANKEDLYTAFLEEVVRRTAYLVAQWQCVGFCHGVLNTDNMSIVGVTIDYGPFGFMDRFDPEFICNASDDGGRYAYSKQPSICKWNCGKLAEAMAPLLPLARSKVIVDELFDEEFQKSFFNKMRLKFGLVNVQFPEDEALVDEFLNTMAETGADFNNCFRCLNQLSLPSMADAFDAERERVLASLLTQCSSVDELQRTFTPDMDMRQFQMLLTLFQSNPDAFGQELGYFKRTIEKLEKLKEIKNMTQAECSERNATKWRTWLHKYTERLKQEEGVDSGREELSKRKRQTMDRHNPRFILRNYIAQRAIDMAEKGDFSEVERVLTLLQDPYALSAESSGSGTDDALQSKADTEGVSSSAVDVDRKCWSYERKPPDWALGLKVT